MICRLLNRLRPWAGGWPTVPLDDEPEPVTALGPSRPAREYVSRVEVERLYSAVLMAEPPKMPPDLLADRHDLRLSLDFSRDRWLDAMAAFERVLGAEMATR